MDRALASAEWVARFPNAYVKHLTTSSSDHSPILINMEDEQVQPPAKPPFRYEVMWETHGEWNDTMRQCWNGDHLALNLEDLRAKLTDVANNLGKWNRETFGSVRKEIKKLLEEQERLPGDLKEWDRHTLRLKSMND